jgi:hypothetical protein
MAIRQNGPENKDDALDRELQAGFQSLARQRGACLSEDTLEHLLHGGLSAAEVESARAHIAACGLCELRLANLESIDAPPRPPFWGVWMRAWRLVRQPAFAYALVLLLAVPAVLEIWPRKPSPNAQAVPSAPSPSSASAPAEWAVEGIPVITLNRERGSGASVRVVPAAADDLFALAFYIPEIRGHHYQAQVISRSGAARPAVRLADSDGLGTFQLLCRRASFPPGSYRLKVWDEAGTGSDGDEYAFEVR